MSVFVFKTRSVVIFITLSSTLFPPGKSSSYNGMSFAQWQDQIKCHVWIKNQSCVVHFRQEDYGFGDARGWSWGWDLCETDVFVWSRLFTHLLPQLFITSPYQCQYLSQSQKMWNVRSKTLPLMFANFIVRRVMFLQHNSFTFPIIFHCTSDIPSSNLKPQN